MADNLDFAYQIYRTIVKLQNKQIKDRTIKEADIIDISEGDFIRELQQDILNHTKGVADNNLIAEVYKGILKKASSIRDINEITVASKIKLPESLIKETVRDVVSNRENVKPRDMNDNKLGDNLRRPDNNSEILVYTILNMSTLDDRMSFYKSLSDDEKDTVCHELAKETFGETFALAMTKFFETKDDDDLNSQKEQKGENVFTEEEREIFFEPFNNIGIKIDDITSKEDMFIIINILHSIKDFKSLEMIKLYLKTQTLGGKKLEELLSEKYNIENIEEFSKNCFLELDRDSKIKQVNELTQKRMEMINFGVGRLLEFISSQLGEKFALNLTNDDINKIFLMTIDPETGEIDPQKATDAMKTYVIEKNIEEFDERSFFSGINENRSMLSHAKQLYSDANVVYNDTDGIDNPYAGLEFDMSLALGPDVKIADDEIGTMFEENAVEIDTSAINEKQIEGKIDRGEIEEVVVINLGTVVTAAKVFAEQGYITSHELKELIPLELVKAGKGEQILNDTGLEEPDQDI